MTTKITLTVEKSIIERLKSKPKGVTKHSSFFLFLSTQTSNKNKLICEQSKIK
jgi:hypothetical protein